MQKMKFNTLKDLTKTNNKTYKVVTVNGSKYVSTPERIMAD